MVKHMERKDIGGHIEGEIVLPKRNGNKAVLLMKVGIMVEVHESDDWGDMSEQAKDRINERLKEGKGFYPYSSEVDLLYTDTEVDDLKHNTFVSERKRL